MIFFSLYSLVSNTKYAIGSTNKWDRFDPTKVRTGIAAMNMLEFLIQFFSDVVRGGGYTWYLLNICRMWFVGWGIAIAIGFSLWTLRLWRFYEYSAAVSATTMERIFAGFIAHSLFGLLTCFTSCVYLSQPQISLDGLMVLYDVDTAVELSQCCVAGLLFAPAAWSQLKQPEHEPESPSIKHSGRMSWEMQDTKPALPSSSV